MSYKLETQWNSPNYTPASEVFATWGRNRTIEAIAIHWWGDPNTGPSYEGVVATLINPARGASAHFVVTGTGRRAAQLVNFQDASWATNSANPYTVSIECDPRCRDEDYDTVAEVIAQIRDVYGDLPLVPHKQFVATACPGNYNLSRLDQLARTKDGSGDWGKVTNKVVTPPAQTAPVWVNMDTPRHLIAAKDLYVYDLAGKANAGNLIKKGTDIDFLTKTTWNGKLYLRTRYSTTNKLNLGISYDDLAEIPAVTPTPLPETPPKPTESLPVPSESQSGTITPSEATTLLEDLIRLWNKFVTFLSKYKRSK